MTPENKKVIIPNSVITSNPVTNISGPGLIRVDMSFGIGYSDDIDKARTVIETVASSCPHLVEGKEVGINISELADSSVNFAVHPWCHPDNYWNVYFYFHENVKKAFDEQGVSIPFPQMDVHMDQLK
jgi:small conductance mechanosensitive channel